MVTKQDILRRMNERILILDGATGTYLQQLGLTEDDFRGSLFASHRVPLKGCNDVLCLTNPDVIIEMHRRYLEAGADIIETNSFNCNRFSLADYALEDRVYEIARAAAECARAAIASRSSQLGCEAPSALPLIAGSIGPTNRTSSISADVNNPASREVTFAQLVDTYTDCVRGLIDGGADIILVETIFDTLNAKAAIRAIDLVGGEKGIEIPVMASATLADASGRTLSGQTVEAYVASLSHANLLSIGLNCAFGARQLRPWLERLARVAPCAVSVHPNAGLPNVMGGYDETPETFAAAAREFMAAGIVNIYGGCCGTTPAHIRSLAQAAKEYKPKAPLFISPVPSASPLGSLTLSGLEALTIAPSSPETNAHLVSVGERTNVAGSAKFKRLIIEGNYEEALSIARAQVDAGAQIIDVCMDDGMIDGVSAMTHFLNLIASEPEIARVPVMIDSSKWEILEAGLQCVQGKSIINSISLKEGEEKFLAKARYIHSMGAATIVMLFDEKGQADSYERKIEVARRAYSLLKGIGFPTQDIIFDPNVLAVATGMPEHDDYGRAFIEACRTIHNEMPEVHMSGGISNLSFSFRGNNTIRQAMHSVFLYHAIKAGLDMSIVNPAMLTIYDEIPEPLRTAVEDVILNRDAEAAERLIAFAQKVKEEEDAEKAANGGKVAKKEEAMPKNLRERINYAMLKGITDNIEADALEALEKEGTMLGVIDNYLMPAMEQVGKLFGEGKMFLPQVVKSARVMKKAMVPLLASSSPSPTDKHQEEVTSLSPTGETKRGVSIVIMATVKGDVHDIGKNIVSVVTQCNGYDVKDLGVMVDPETIVDEAQRTSAAVIGLSGLITPSLNEMINVVRLLEKRGMTTPVIVGGATTSALHTAVKMAPEYPHGIVIRAHAAADNPAIIRRLLSDERDEYINELRAQQRILRDNYLSREADKSLLTVEEARRRRHVKLQSEVAVPRSTDLIHMDDVAISAVSQRIDWAMFYQAWGMKGETRTSEEGLKLKADAETMLKEMEQKHSIRLAALARILPAYSTDNDEIIISLPDVTSLSPSSETKKGAILPFPRSLRDEPETHCLADYIIRKDNLRKLRLCPCCNGQHATDFIAPFVVTAGIGLRELQAEYRKDGDDYHAIMAKLLCDRLAEALAEHVQDYLHKNLFWGDGGIRMAFGYGACPDHSLKVPVMKMLRASELLGLSLTDSHMITPEESICGLIFANTPTKYFNV